SVKIDNDPLLAFQLHHVDLITEHSDRGLFLDTSNVVVEPLSGFYFNERSAKQKPATFDSSNAYQKLSFATLSPIPEALMALLNESPAFYNASGDFKTKYLVALNRIVRIAKRILDGKA